MDPAETHYTGNREKSGSRGTDYTEMTPSGNFRGSEDCFSGIILTSKVVKMAKILREMHLAPFFYSP